MNLLNYLTSISGYIKHFTSVYLIQSIKILKIYLNFVVLSFIICIGYVLFLNVIEHILLVAVLKVTVCCIPHHGTEVTDHELWIIIAHEKRHDDVASYYFSKKSVKAVFESYKSTEVASICEFLVVPPQSVRIIQVKSKRFLWALLAPRSLYVSRHDIILKLEIMLHVLDERNFWVSVSGLPKLHHLVTRVVRVNWRGR